MRHLISGEDCAIAGEATAAMAAPVAEALKKSRRFIKTISLSGVFPDFARPLHDFQHRRPLGDNFSVEPKDCSVDLGRRVGL
jgi:hypothetical protein